MAQRFRSNAKCVANKITIIRSTMGKKSSVNICWKCIYYAFIVYEWYLVHSTPSNLRAKWSGDNLIYARCYLSFQVFWSVIKTSDKNPFISLVEMIIDYYRHRFRWILTNGHGDRRRRLFVVSAWYNIFHIRLNKTSLSIVLNVSRTFYFSVHFKELLYNIIRSWYLYTRYRSYCCKL